MTAKHILKNNLLYKNRFLIPFNIYRVYNAIAKTYSRDEPKFRDDLISRPLIVSYAKHFAYGKDIIDVGCGDGHISRLIAPFARRVIGVDISDSMLAEARFKSRFLKKVEFIKSDFLQLSLLNQKFDLAIGVFAFCCVKNTRELDAAFRSMYQVLRKGGTAIIQIPNDKEMLAESKSEWISEIPYSSDDVGKLVTRQLKTINDDWVNVARYHFRLSEYLESIKNASFKITEIIEPKATSKLLDKYPSLKHEAEISSSFIFVLSK